MEPSCFNLLVNQIIVHNSSFYLAFVSFHSWSLTVGGMGFIPERLLMVIDDDDDDGSPVSDNGCNQSILCLCCCMSTRLGCLMYFLTMDFSYGIR